MKIRDMNILVTGGASFIGSHIVANLLAEGAHVVVYDNLSTGNMSNLDSVTQDIRFFKGDILDRKQLCKATFCRITETL